MEVILPEREVIINLSLLYRDLWHTLPVREELYMSVKLLNNMKTLAQIVRRMRKKKKLSQVELAGVSNTGPRFIVDLEKGKASCQIAKVLQVLKTLNIKLEILFF